MATVNDIIARVRKELGDFPEPFRQTYRGTGDQNKYDLPVERVSTTGLDVYTVDSTNTDTTLVLDTDFTLDADNGTITLTAGPLAQDVLLVAQGTAYGMFTDDDLTQYVNDAVSMHTSGNIQTTRYRDGHGFIRYERVPETLDNLPDVEELPLSVLAAANALWDLMVDASTDINVQTSEGTDIDRGQRYQQLQEMYALAQTRYENLCGMLGIGLYRIEIMNLRRVSRSTNRLVPEYIEREYDETTLPTRKTPEVDTRDADWDGPPSPAYQQGVY